MCHVWQPLKHPPDMKNITELSPEADTVWNFILEKYSDKKQTQQSKRIQALESDNYYASLYQKDFNTPLSLHSVRNLDKTPVASQSHRTPTMWPFVSQSTHLPTGLQTTQTGLSNQGLERAIPEVEYSKKYGQSASGKILCSQQSEQLEKWDILSSTRMRIDVSTLKDNTSFPAFTEVQHVNRDIVLPNYEKQQGNICSTHAKDHVSGEQCSISPVRHVRPVLTVPLNTIGSDSGITNHTSVHLSSSELCSSGKWLPFNQNIEHSAEPVDVGCFTLLENSQSLFTQSNTQGNSISVGKVQCNSDDYASESQVTFISSSPPLDLSPDQDTFGLMKMSNSGKMDLYHASKYEESEKYDSMIGSRMRMGLERLDHPDEDILSEYNTFSNLNAKPNNNSKLSSTILNFSPCTCTDNSRPVQHGLVAENEMAGKHHQVPSDIQVHSFFDQPIKEVTPSILHRDTTCPEVELNTPNHVEDDEIQPQDSSTNKRKKGIVMDETGRKKRKGRFAVPLKPITDFLETSVTAKRSPSTGDPAKGSPLLALAHMSEEERESQATQIRAAGEVAFTLLYDDGTSQLRELDKPKKRKDNDISVKVAGLALAFPAKQTDTSDDSCSMQYVFMNLNTKCIAKIFYRWVRDLVNDIMSSTTVRKLCFDGQEMMQNIIQIFGFDSTEVVSKWKIMDPKIALWLLDPDHSAITFAQVLQRLDGLNQVTSVSNKDELVCRDLDLLGPVMLQLYERLCDRHMWSLFVTVETPLAPILAVMETRSVQIDIQRMRQACEILKKKLKKLEQACHKAAGHTFTLNSHPQLRQVLFEELQLDLKLPRNKKMHRTAVRNHKSTSEAVLTQLQELHPLPKLMLEHRQLQKLKSTYIDGMIGFVENGYLHTCWDQTSAATGRLSSANPNIQSIPKQPVTLTWTEDNYIAGREEKEVAVEINARAPFVSREGFSFLAVDFQQIELRLLAHLSQDSHLLKVFNDAKCNDIFIQLTSQWLNKKTEEVTQADREKTKRVVYSVMYGVGKERLSEYLKTSSDDAKCIMTSFLIIFPGLNTFTRKCVEQARKQGYQTTILCRRRLLPNIQHSNANLRAQSERQAVNFCIQGSAADLCKVAMIQVEHMLAAETNVEAKLLFQIHDELLLEVKDEHCKRVADMVKKVMESRDGLCGNKLKLSVPLKVSLSNGKSWGDMKEQRFDEDLNKE